jgi:Putative MetA-pathway of phenol degradation
MTRSCPALLSLPGPRLAALLLTVAVCNASAQELEPRSYTNTPIGMNFLLTGFDFRSGSAAANPSIPLENAYLRSYTAFLGYSRSVDVWGTSAKINVVLPYSSLSGSAELSGQPRTRSTLGFGDPSVKFSVNLYGAPALSMKAFERYKQDLIVGVSLRVDPPLGEYDADRLVNIGANRWSFKPELGVSKALGQWTLELAAGVTFYTDNDDFLGGQTRSQEPLYSLQGHVIYSFQSGIWAALDGTYYTGGSTSVDGGQSIDRLYDSRVGLTVVLPVDRFNSVKFYGSTATRTTAGTDFKAIGVAWQYRWGGGLQ